MIMVEIVVPSMEKEYDFQLDENTYVDTLTEEIVEMISHKEQSNVVNGQKFVLCLLRQETILKKNSTLGRQGVINGDKLLLV